MNLTNKQIREQARHLLDDNVFGKDWLKSVLTLTITAAIGSAIVSAAATVTSIIVTLISSLLLAFLPDANELLISIIAYLVTYLAEVLVGFGIAGNMGIGIASVNLDLVRGDGHISIRKFLDGFRNFFDHFIIGFMVTLQIALWSMLFVVPGVYVALSYALVYHVKNDHPEYTWRDCLDESERLMTGNRWRYFKLVCSFFGWSFLSFFATCGVGTIWVTAYMETSIAIFHEQVKAEKDSLLPDSTDMGSTSPVIYGR